MTLLNSEIGNEVLKEIERMLDLFKGQPLDKERASLFTEAILKKLR